MTQNPDLPRHHDLRARHQENGTFGRPLQLRLLSLGFLLLRDDFRMLLHQRQADNLCCTGHPVQAGCCTEHHRTRHPVLLLCGVGHGHPLCLMLYCLLLVACRHYPGPGSHYLDPGSSRKMQKLILTRNLL
jgi:hypothetical protein